jgi:DNA replication protein DnaC
MSSTVQAELNRHLKALHLSTIREIYPELSCKATRENLGYELFLAELVVQEVEARRVSRIERYLRESSLPLEKSWKTFEQKRLPVNQLLQVKTLLEGSFLDRRENVLVFGNPGSGKTHLLCAVGQELILMGRRIYFSNCNFLVQELLKAKQELRLAKLMKKYSKYEAIIIDDLGYVQQNREEMEVLFTLLAERYERGSLMMTSNLPFSKWEAIFKDPMTTAAAIDRVVHHSVILELNLPSYRMEAAKKRKEEEQNKGKQT